MIININERKKFEGVNNNNNLSTSIGGLTADFVRKWEDWDSDLNVNGITSSENFVFTGIDGTGGDGAISNTVTSISFSARTLTLNQSNTAPLTATFNLLQSDIPSLDASKITSGTFTDARIPTLGISKITGLQVGLDAKVDNTRTITINGITQDLSANRIFTIDTLSSVNLSYTASPTNGVINNTSGDNATLPTVTTVNSGLMLPADKSKLDGIANNANNYVHPTFTVINQTLTGAVVPATLVTNSIGSVTGFTTRTLTPANIGAEPAFNKGNIIQGSGVTLTGTLLNRLVGTGDITITNSAPHIATNLSIGSNTASVVRVDSSTGNNVNIPLASATLAGIVSNGTQSFGGLKTFTDYVQSPNFVFSGVDGTGGGTGGSIVTSISFAGRTLTLSQGGSADLTASFNLVSGDIPNLDTSKITSGTFTDARIPALGISKITGLQTALDGKANNTITLTGGDGITTTIGNLTANRSISVDSTVVRTSGNQTISGDKSFTGTTNINALNGNGKRIFDTGDVYLRINQGSAFSAGTWFGGTLVRADGFYAGSNGGTTTSRIAIIGGSHNGTNVITLNGNNGNVTASTFSGSLSGNATTATTLQTARTFTIGNSSKTFNGGGNVSWSIAEIGAQPAGSYLTDAGFYNHRTYTRGDNFLGGYYVSGGTEKPNNTIFGAGKLKVAMLSGSNLGFGGSWNDVLWLSTYTGGDVKSSLALVSSKYSDDVFIAKQNFDSSTWGAGRLLLTNNNFNNFTPNLTGSGASGTWGISITGNASTSTTFSTNRSTYKGVTDNAVIGQLMWKNYGNNHTIFDASNSTTPSGTACNNANSQVAWTGTYPTLMGWNGSSTYGVRVDSARVSDNTTGNALTATRLQTARTINGVSFNGTANITLPTVNTSGNQNVGGQKIFTSRIVGQSLTTANTGNEMTLLRSGGDVVSVARNASFEIGNTTTGRYHILQHNTDGFRIYYFNGSGWVQTQLFGANGVVTATNFVFG